jgi:hypothetical protein
MRAGFRTRVGEPLTPTEVADTCHAIIAAVSALLSNLEFLEDRSTGSDAGREATASDARTSVKRVVDLVRTIQKDARAAVRRVA